MSSSKSKSGTKKKTTAPKTKVKVEKPIVVASEEVKNEEIEKVEKVEEVEVGDTEADLRAQLEKSQKLIEEMQAMLKSLSANNVTTTATMVQSPSIINTDVTLVYCSTSPGYLFVEGSGLSLNCTKYGETFVLSRGQLDSLVGKYRRWFDDGRLALSDADAKVAAEKGVNTFSSLNLKSVDLENLGNMTVTELEALWRRLKLDSQRSSLVLYYKDKFIAHEKGFRDRDKIDLLNRLTNNGFVQEAREVSGLNTVIGATQLI